MSSWQKTAPKRKLKRSDKSVLGQAQKSHTPQEPKKLQHITTKRAGPPRRAGRKPPSRKPMVERTTKIRSGSIISEDVSLVANKKELPKTSSSLSMTERPIINEKVKQIQEIEKSKRKSSVQTVGKHSVMRIFLDNNGIGFKTLNVKEECTMAELVQMMRKKIFTDTTGFGIWEVRDKLDVALLKPNETVGDVMEYWGENEKSYKFVFKKALGENAKLYFQDFSKMEKKMSFGALGNAPLPKLKSSTEKTRPAPSSLAVESTTKQESTSPTKTEEPKGTSGTSFTPSATMPQKPPKPTTPLEPTIIEQNSPGQGRRVPPSLPKSVSNEENNPNTPAGNAPSPKRKPPPRGRGNVPMRARGQNSPLRRGSPRRGAPPRGNSPMRGRGSTLRGPSRIQGETNARPESSMPQTVVQVEPEPVLQPEPLSAPEPEPEPELVLQPEPPVLQPEPLLEPEPVLEPEPALEPETAQEPDKPTQPVSTDAENSSPYGKHITEWSIEEVADWVDSLGFGAVKKIFSENFISGRELVDLTNEELKEDLGVMALGARKGILRSIKQLNT